VVSTAITVSREWASTSGKVFLWKLVMSLVTDVEHFRKYTQNVGFLSYDVIFLKVDCGLALYTVNKLQVNVNVLVPMDPSLSVDLVRQVEQYISCIYADHAINLVPLQSHVPELSVAEFVKRRRVIPSRAYISKLSVTDCEERRLSCGDHQIVALRRLECIRDVASYRPLSKMHVDDDVDTTYWYRFACGAIFTFTNPVVDLVEPLPYPEPLHKGVIISRHMDESICHFIYALHPFTLTDSLRVVAQRWIPPNMRELCVCSAISTFGITDELIIVVGENFDKPPPPSGFLNEMMHTFEVLQMTSSSSDICMCDMLVSTLLRLDDTLVWRKWISESTLLWTCVIRIPCALLDTLFRRADMERFRTMCTRLFHHRIGAWTPEEKQRVSVLCRVVHECALQPPPSCATEMEAVRRAFETLSAAANVMLNVLVDEVVVVVPEITTKPKRPKKSKKKSALVTPDELIVRPLTPPPPSTTQSQNTNEDDAVSFAVCQCVAMHTPQRKCDLCGVSSTHTSLLERMRLQFPSLQFELIGSGIFSNMADVDVVVTIAGSSSPSSSSAESLTGSLSLPEAYEHVSALTGWIPNYQKVDGTHVSVLCGVFDGVSVDAQVWRGEGLVATQSEVLTHEALAFTRRVLVEADVAAIAAARWLHAWCAVAGLKGHKLCRLPGVGVTCAAIALTCGSRKWSPETLLSRMRECLSTESPLINFDTLQVTVDSVATRCTVPLTVVVNERNCCNRMTAATTRHMVDVVAYALAQSVDVSVLSSVYTEWRRHNMVVCTHMRPRTTTSVTYSLLSVAASLERHPIIDSLYFAHDDDAQRDYHADGNQEATSAESLAENNEHEQSTTTTTTGRDAERSSCVTVLCTLRADADVHIYGFRCNDHIRQVRRSTIDIERNGRIFTLALSPRRATTKCCVRSATRICDMLHVDGMSENVSFPNAVSLTCDVSALFDPKLWEPCLSSS